MTTTLDDALVGAASRGCLEQVREYLDAGADANAHDGWALCVAAWEGHIQTCIVLLECGANPRARDGQAALIALKEGYKGLYALLDEWDVEGNKR